MPTVASEPRPTPSADSGPLLAVESLTVTFATRRGVVRAVDGISYVLEAGRTLGVVGESGCGKSVTALALLGLVDPPGKINGGRVMFEGRDLLTLDEAAMEGVRGARIAMIFQEPMTALNPVYTIGDQIGEVFTTHRGHSRGQARDGAIDMLERVGMPAPARRARDYPHQLSGGMRQRAMIAMALAGRPALLIADEPTTALDVTVQAQILELMLDIQDSFGTAIQFISHDLGVISEIADEVAVMYAGRIVEHAAADVIFDNPLHPYTQGLLATVPRIGAGLDRLPAISGNVPDLARLPAGCAFRDRCPKAGPDCAVAPPLDIAEPGHRVACFRVAR
jgi:oligopeptide/dipeptide ABC transporter ATP-binding protein